MDYQITSKESIVELTDFIISNTDKRVCLQGTIMQKEIHAQEIFEDPC